MITVRTKQLTIEQRLRILLWMKRRPQTEAQRQRTRQRQSRSRRQHHQRQVAAEAARRRKRARNEREDLLWERFAILRDEARPAAGLSDCFLKYWILPYQRQRRDRSRVTAALVSDFGVFSKRVSTFHHTATPAKSSYTFSPSEEALSGSMQGVATRHSQTSSTCGSATSLPATTCYST